MRKVVMAVMLAWPGVVLADEVVIAALGDSLTQGYGLVEEQGFVPQMQAWLDNRQAGARLINAGVSGDTTAGGLNRAAWTLTPEVDALIVTLGGNDLLRGIDPGLSRTNLEGILQAAQAADVQVLLIGLEAPGNFGPDYKSSFDAIYPELAETYDTVFAPRFFAGLGDAATLESLRAFMQPDGIHPNAEGIRRIVSELGPYVVSLIDRVEQD